MRGRSVGSSSPEDTLLKNERVRDQERKKERKKEQFSMSESPETDLLSSGGRK